MENHAISEGYEHMNLNEKMQYLNRRAQDLWEIRTKRMTIEEVQEGWIGKERLVTGEAMQAEASSRLQPGPSRVQPETDSDYGISNK